MSEKCNDTTALITPSDKQLRLLARELNKSSLSREALCSDAQIQKAVLDAILESCSSAGLHRRETPVSIHLCPEEWLPDNELLTAAFKLKRKNVMQFYRKEVEQMFAQLST